MSVPVPQSEDRDNLIISQMKGSSHKTFVVLMFVNVDCRQHGTLTLAMLEQLMLYSLEHGMTGVNEWDDELGINVALFFKDWLLTLFSYFSQHTHICI